GDRDAKRPSTDRGARPAYGDRDAKRPYGDRDAKRPSTDRGARPAYGDRDAKRPYGDRDAKRPSTDRGAKPAYGDRDAKRPYGDRDAKRPSTDRGARPAYGDRDAKRPYGDRDAKRPFGGAGRSDDRRGGAGGRPDARGGPRDESRETFGASDLAIRPRHDAPEIPERIEARDLEKSARGELRTLSKENADWVARHLVAASELLEDDPELAHEHAISAGRRAGRIAVVRETLAITAYATGDFALALRELRTYRRISGKNDQLPLMVDSERGVGRPDRALEVGRAVDRAELAPAVQVGLAIAMSGARLDLGQPELALAELEIPQLEPDRAFSYSPALFSAYAEVLDELGRTADAATWRVRAERAEAALSGPAESEVFEIFEVELEDEEEVSTPMASAESRDDSVDADTPGGTDETDDSAEVGESDDAATETEAEGGEQATSDEAIEDDEDDEDDFDPGSVLEDDVAAVLAEGAELDAAGGPDDTEGAPDGAVPTED
ncbi:hypothetical protein J7E29_16495, partial [Streptomyces sp. ISL-90]|nr:hypothetical protein [Streptomyces sp. ISL-90]